MYINTARVDARNRCNVNTYGTNRPALLYRATEPHNSSLLPCSLYRDV